MRLRRFLLRYYPPGIILEYEQSKTLKTKSIDLLDLKPESDVDAILDDIVAKEPLVTPSKMEQVRKLILHPVSETVSDSVFDPVFDPVSDPVSDPVFDPMFDPVLRAHILPLTNVAFNKSGSSFITGSYDRTCKIWDTASGEELHTLEGHKNVVYAVAYNNPYGDKIATGSFDKTAKLWNSETGKCYHTFRGHTSEIVCLSFNLQSTVIATGSMDHTAKLWDLQKGVELCTLSGHSAEIICASFNTVGDQLLTGSFDHTVSIWDVRSGRRIHTLIGHRGEISNAQFNFDCSLIVSGSMDKTCKIWDTSSGKCIGTLRGHDDEVLDVCFDYTGQYIVTGSADGSARVYNAVTHQCICKLEGHEGEISKKSYVMTIISDRNASIKLLEATEEDTVFVFIGIIMFLAMGSDLSGINYATLSNFPVYAVLAIFNPQGNRILTAGSDKTARLWDPFTGECVQILEGHTDEIFSCAFNYEGDIILTEYKVLSQPICSSFLAWDLMTAEAEYFFNCPVNVEAFGPVLKRSKLDWLRQSKR
eukprot:gene16681-8123_t